MANTYLTGAELHSQLLNAWQLAKYRYDQLVASDPFNFKSGERASLGSALYSAEVALANEASTAAKNQSYLDAESERKAAEQKAESEFNLTKKSAQSRLDSYRANYATYAQNKLNAGAKTTDIMSFQDWAKIVGYDYAADQEVASKTYTPQSATTTSSRFENFLKQNAGFGETGSATVTAPITTTPTTTTNTPKVTVPTSVTTPTTATTTPATATTKPESWLGTITGQNNTTDTRTVRNPLGDTSTDWITNLFGGNKTRVANPFSQTTRSVKTPFTNYGQLYNYQR